jgi:hypothetical protein
MAEPPVKRPRTDGGDIADTNLTRVVQRVRAMMPVFTPLGFTEFHVACIYGLLGASAQIKTPGGNTGLLLACANGHTDVARWLVAHVGAAILQDDALSAACSNKHWATCEWLIDEHMVPVRRLVGRPTCRCRAADQHPVAACVPVPVPALAPTEAGRTCAPTRRRLTACGA